MDEAVLNALPELAEFGRLSKYFVDPTKLPAPPTLDVDAILQVNALLKKGGELETTDVGSE